MEESLYLKKCCDQIEEKLKWGCRNEWINSDYIRLSDKIYSVSHILISPLTLKRIFGKTKTYKKEYNPQEVTKNALAIFLGFENWDNYIESVKNEIASKSPLAKKKIENGNLFNDYDKNINYKLFRGSNSSIKKLFFFCILSFIIIFASFEIYFQNIEGKVKINAEKARGYVPFTAVFNYDISMLQNKNAYLNFGYNLEKYPLPKDKNTVTHWFSIPGLYRVKFFIDEKNIPEKTMPVHVLSKGWKTIWRSFDYVENKKIESYSENGILKVNTRSFEDFLSEKNERYWINQINSMDFNVSGDNFMFEVRIKVPSQMGYTSCNDLKINLHGETEDFIVHFLKQGCEKWLHFQFSEVIHDGEFEDFSQFSQDLSNFNIINLIVKNKEATIKFNGKSIFTEHYTKPIGEIKDINFESLGLSEIDYVYLYDQDNNLVYKEDFEHYVVTDSLKTVDYNE